MMASKTDVTQLLDDLSNGDRKALNDLLPVVYEELRRLAESFMRHERPNHTLQPTALVHEAYLRLVDQREVNWQNRAHFFSIAAETMRRILVNHAYSRQAQKRGGNATLLSLEDAVAFSEGREVDLMLLDDALKRLENLDPDQARIVELRFFAGLTVPEVSEIVKRSTATVEREWRTAKAWLHNQIM
jgi:RNA polymerase sigma factor (TIGR02999 family)